MALSKTANIVLSHFELTICEIASGRKMARRTHFFVFFDIAPHRSLCSDQQKSPFSPNRSAQARRSARVLPRGQDSIARRCTAPGAKENVVLLGDAQRPDVIQATRGPAGCRFVEKTIRRAKRGDLPRPTGHPSA
jgi:hypothetical protein